MSIVSNLQKTFNVSTVDIIAQMQSDPNQIMRWIKEDDAKMCAIIMGIVLERAKQTKKN